MKTENEFVFDKENMEDENRGNSPRVDLAVYLKESHKIDISENIAKYTSLHKRTKNSPKIKLYHLWVKLN